MEEDIYNFPKQLKWKAEIENKDKWQVKESVFLAGMGGSHLQGDILKGLDLSFPFFVHKNYDLPDFDIDKTSIITASYSGNTQETVSSFLKATDKGASVLSISKGGKIHNLAKEMKTPFIKLPQEKVQPRMAVGYSFKALLRALNLVELEKEAENLSVKLLEKADKLKKKGSEIASLMQEKVPVVYSSEENGVVSSIFKINFNETSKIPSFYNTLPELNHNEMTGFDVVSMSKHLSKNMKFVFLRDSDDSERIKKRFDVLKMVLEKREFEILEVDLDGETRMEKVFTGLIISAWTAYYLSFYYKTEPSEVPMVEEFKEMI